MGSAASSDSGLADSCVVKGLRARDTGNLLAALAWLEEALRVRAAVVGDAPSASFDPKFTANLIYLGEIHYWLRRFDRAIVYFMRAKELLDPALDLIGSLHTATLPLYVNLTAGLTLALTKVEATRNYAGQALLEGESPIAIAQMQVEMAVARVVEIEGPRAPALVSLYHMCARVYLIQNKRLAALRVMQRCLGLTLHVASTRRIVGFLSYTRNVLDGIKTLTNQERAVVRLQQWFRDKRAARLREQMPALAPASDPNELPALRRGSDRLAASDDLAGTFGGAIGLGATVGGGLGATQHLIPRRPDAPGAPSRGSGADTADSALDRRDRMGPAHAARPNSRLAELGGTLRSAGGGQLLASFAARHITGFSRLSPAADGKQDNAFHALRKPNTAAPALGLFGVHRIGAQAGPAPTAREMATLLAPAPGDMTEGPTTIGTQASDRTPLVRGPATRQHQQAHPPSTMLAEAMAWPDGGGV
jgi:hypothetical protein